MSLSIAVLLAVADPILPDWMAGCWEQRVGKRWTEECWTIPRAGMMMGSSRNGDGDQLLAWETMQVVMDPAGGISFFGAPSGLNRIRFGWIASAAPGLSFVNAAHDYPQRIRYWREGEDLLAEISLLDGRKPMRWRYRRTGN